MATPSGSTFHPFPPHLQTQPHQPHFQTQQQQQQQQQSQQQHFQQQQQQQPPSQFPWTSLKADCLRLIVSQLLESLPGEHTPVPIVATSTGNKARMSKKEDMIEFLGEVERVGVQHALAKLSHAFAMNSSSTLTTTNAVASGSALLKMGNVKSNKRKSPEVDEEGAGGDEDAEGETDADEEGYNTRFKGVKRVRVGEAVGDEKEGGDGNGNGNTNGKDGTTTPKKRGRPRKVPGEPAVVKPRGRPRKSVVVEGESATPSPKKRGRPRKSEEVKEKRPRGRPRKSVAGVVGGDAGTSGTGGGQQGEGVKQVFDGVVLKARNVAQASAADDVEGDVDAEGEEEDAEGDVTMNLAEEGVVERENDLSSLGDSNKENEPTISMMVYTPEESEPVAAVENDA